VSRYQNWTISSAAFRKLTGPQGRPDSFENLAFAKPVAIAQAKKGSKSTAALRRRGKQWTLNFVASGANRPLIARPIAALQLPENGHSSIAQHFYRSDDGSVDFAGLLFLLWHKSGCAFLTGRIKPHLCSVNGGVRTGQLAEQMSAT
jgi:hypothetical protein